MTTTDPAGTPLGRADHPLLGAATDTPIDVADGSVDTSDVDGATGPRPLDRSCKVALWSQLRDDIARRITAGEFTDSFPGEHALTEQYRVSRQTVRVALRSLREAGVISAARGQKPEVLRPQVEQPMGTLYSLFATVEAAGMSQTSVVLGLDERRDAYAAAQLGLEEEAPLVFLHRLRLADGDPLALDRVWLPASLARPLLGADFTHTALYDELAGRCGIRSTTGREEVDAVVLSAPQARTLGAAEGSAAFSIQRTSCVDDVMVEWRTTLVRADRFRISTSFSALSGSRLVVPGFESSTP